MFADKVEIEVLAGAGGNGKVSFRREKYQAKGGPDGGDGGRGGNIVFQVDHNVNTLAHYKTNRIIRAQEGQAGGPGRRHGANGEDAFVKVPPGTVVWQGEEKLVDLGADDPDWIAASGGRGGFGNAHFVSSTRQAPRVAELGEPGEDKRLVLELKLVADIGLVGLPNAGKSTLLSVISNAKPAIADYPFTTLIPNLGVVDFNDYSFVVADIPGLIEGASQGKGLGDDFLRHIERTAVLLHLIDATSSDVASDWRVITKELADYTIDLSAKPQITILTKIDALDDSMLKQRVEELKRAGAKDVLAISAPAHKGLTQMLAKAVQMVKEARQVAKDLVVPTQIPVIGVESQPELWQVHQTAEGYVVTGTKIEGFARRTDWQNPDAVQRFRDIMKKMGIVRELTRLGAQPGDKIIVGTSEFDY